MNYINKIFSKYFNNYKNILGVKIGALIRASDQEIMKVALDEMYKILDILSGRMVSQTDVPHPHMFPSSKQWNLFLEHLNIDLDKLYNANKLIINDIQNVVNYNSSERDNITFKLSKTQSEVYNAYISSQKGLSGSIIIKEDFNTEDSARDSDNLSVDESVKTLTLRKKETVEDSKIINTDMVDASHFTEQKNYKLYPNALDLALGSFWDIPKNGAHLTNKYDMVNYKQGLVIDGTAKSVHKIGSCQFESVITIDEDSDLHKKIENKVSTLEHIPVNDIMVNRPDSIWDKYITTTNKFPQSKIKLKIPLKSGALLSTGFILKLRANNSYNLPSIDSDNSFVITTTNIDNNIKTNRVGIDVISKDTTDDYGNDQGIYTIMYDYPIVPTALELVFTYGGDGWALIEYIDNIWKLIINHTVALDIQVEGQAASTELISYKKELYIVLDKEGNINNELTRRSHIFTDNKGVK